MSMRKFLLLAGVLLSLAGCLSAPTSMVGNFIPNTAKANDKKMADDAVKQLVALYPPASTRIDLEHGTPDFFGTSLVESMRAKGYAVLEFNKPKTASAGTLAPAAPSLPLAYIVDQAKGSDLQRITLRINRQQSLSRVYQVAQDGAVSPAGYWVRKE
jgi:type IV secretion system protein TrbH